MAKQVVNIGTVANDGTGDDLRTGADKINDNFTELYDAVALLPQKFSSTMNVMQNVTSSLVTTITTEPFSVQLLDTLNDITPTVTVSWSKSGANYVLDILSTSNYTGLKVKIIY